MIVAAWLLCWFVLILTAAALAAIGLKRWRLPMILSWIKEGFRHALLDCGFRFPPPPQEPVLWWWVTCDDEATCPGLRRTRLVGTAALPFLDRSRASGPSRYRNLVRPELPLPSDAYHFERSAGLANEKR